MKPSYDEALEQLLEHEGGYSDDPGDRGGPTKYGITIWDARAYWKPNATASDVRSLPLSVAKEIYRTKYWAKVDGDDLPAGVDYAIFDYGVNSGISRAAKVLQRLTGATVDGVIGPKTVAATRAYVEAKGAAKLINAIQDERLDFLQGLGIWRIFGRGWSRRVKEVRTLALDMAQRV
jgi:lysozyme family protein